MRPGFWFAGPSFTARHEYRPATASFSTTNKKGVAQTIPGYEGGLGTKNAYSDNFFLWTHDFNADGWIDILLIDMPNKPAHWFENPKDRDGHWTRHTIFDQVDNESPTFTDLTGDGRAEIIVGANNGIHLLSDVGPLGDQAWPTFHRDAKRTGAAR